MGSDSTVSTRAAQALLLVVMALNIYRAAALPVTTSEAYTFDHWVRPPLRDVVAHSDGNNHFLYTVLAKRTVGLFHLSEFSLRLPAVIASAFFLWALYRLARRVAGTGPWMPVILAAVALHPVVLDAMASARGYGLALALFLWSWDFLARDRLEVAGWLLGLSVAANLWFAFPALALLLRRSPGILVTVERFLIPAVACAFIILVLPLSHMDFADPVAPRVPPPLWWPDFRPHAFSQWPEDARARDLIAALRRGTGDRPARISASPRLLPILNFYRSRYRFGNWTTQPWDAPGEYHVWGPGDPVANGHRIFFEVSGLVLSD